MRRTFPLTALPILAALLLAACGDVVTDASSGSADPEEAVPHLAAAEGVTVTVHRSDSCECCGVYEHYLEEVGFTVERAIHEDLPAVKERFGVPEGSWSCHTNEIGGYAAEGHVPAEALLQMLDEGQDIDGITLPGMPAGSPGMPGEQQAPFVVRTFVDGRITGDLADF